MFYHTWLIKFAIAIVLPLYDCNVSCCDLETLFNSKQVSVEDSAASAQIIFKGFTTAEAPALSGYYYFEDGGGGGDGGGYDDVVYTARFELISTYKGGDVLELWNANNYRQVNVTITSQSTLQCAQDGTTPKEYIIFCNLEQDVLRAVSIAVWSATTDQRIWRVLGWSKWGEWSPCSVSCSAGIQQRTRHCRRNKCPGFNVEQRHCNLFGCANAVNSLGLEEHKFYHPSKDKWQVVPGRPSAWRLRPNSYIWVPSYQLFQDPKNQPFPKEFTLFVTIRIYNHTMGTIFSLRSRQQQDTYLSLELAGPDLKLIHAAANGTDVVRIPVSLDDGMWHQIAISIRDNSVVESYVDCEWSRTYVLRKDTLDIPEDSDLIIGYLFSGDLEQMSIVPDPSVVSQQCCSRRTPIIDPGVKYIPRQENVKKIGDGFKSFMSSHRKSVVDGALSHTRN